MILTIFNMEVKSWDQSPAAALNIFGFTCLDQSKIISLNYNFENLTKAS